MRLNCKAVGRPERGREHPLHLSPLPLKHAAHCVWEVGEVAGVNAEQLLHLTLNSLGMSAGGYTCRSSLFREVPAHCAVAPASPVYPCTLHSTTYETLFVLSAAKAGAADGLLFFRHPSGSSSHLDCGPQKTGPEPKQCHPHCPAYPDDPAVLTAQQRGWRTWQ